MRASGKDGRPATGGRLPAGAGGVAVAVAAVLAALVWTLWPSGAAAPPAFGDRPRAEGPVAGPEPGRPAPSEGEGAAPDEGAADGTAPDGSGAPAARPGSSPDAAAAPRELRIPRVSLDARIEEVGVADDGTVEIPADAGAVGWYRYGSPPGAPGGSAVLVGHVDSRTGDLGAFAALYRVRAGDVVTVGRRDAPPVRYEVTAREVVDKEKLPEEAFRLAGRPILTLITCAPPYDRGRGGYQKNLLVYAVPVAEGEGDGADGGPGKPEKAASARR